MKRYLGIMLLGCTAVAVLAPAQDRPKPEVPGVATPADPGAKDDGNAEPRRPRVIAHSGCYYPFPVPENDPNEPVAKSFSFDRGADYLHGLTRQWTNEVGCVTCHTTLSYVASRPIMKVDSSAPMDELRQFMEYRVANWDTDRPLWDAEVLITATSLAMHDAQTTGTLQPHTRAALERMWSLQQDNGAWDWLKGNSPPFEHDDYYGAVLVAVGVGMAPEDYTTDTRVQDQVAKLRRYFANTPPPTLHHACWLMWAEATLGGVLTAETRDSKVIELEKLQKPDGGWSLPTIGGWKGHDGLPIEEAPSDGYGTGLVMFALHHAGLPAEHEMVRQGVRWLKTHQRESGSWFTGSLGENYHLNFLSHSATAFALMALNAYDNGN